MSRPESKFALATSDTYRELYGVDLHFIGQPPEGESDDIPGWLAIVILELIHNSPWARRLDDEGMAGSGESIEQIQTALANQKAKAKTLSNPIDVIWGSNFVLVDDHCHQQEAEAAVSTIREIVSSGRPRTTKSYSGGVGLFAIKRILDEHHGALKYRLVGDTIVPVATWHPERPLKVKSERG